MASALFLGLVGCGGEAPPERIVLVVVDTLRRDHVGAYGADRPTPHLDRLAREGHVYTNAVSSFHATSMSMGALFTGRTPSLESGRGDTPIDWNPRHWCGLARFAASEDSACIPSGLRSLGEALSEAGYWTVGVTPHPLTQQPYGFDRGFEHWVELEAGDKGMLVFREETKPRFARLRAGDRVNQAVWRALDERPTDHFFLYVHYMDAHDWNLAQVSYATAVQAADAAVGGLLDGLEQRGLLQGTAIVVVSDHGESLGEQHFQPATPRHAGNPAFEPVLRVPLIVTGTDPDLPRDAFVRSEDVFRLLIDIAGGDPGPPSALERDELLVSERVYRTYRSGRWKSFWLRGSDRVRLVDLEADPKERQDRAAEEPAIVEAHRRRIEGLSSELGAPTQGIQDVLPEHLERLRVLGYLEPAYEVEAPVETDR